MPSELEERDLTLTYLNSLNDVTMFWMMMIEMIKLISLNILNTSSILHVLVPPEFVDPLEA